MTGMSLNEFLDKVYYGDEIEFTYRGTTYFIQGFPKNDKYQLVVDYWNKTDGTEPQHDYLYNIICKSPYERMIEFKNAKIFSGKTICEIESEITVTFG